MPCWIILGRFDLLERGVRLAEVVVADVPREQQVLAALGLVKVLLKIEAIVGLSEHLSVIVLVR